MIVLGILCVIGVFLLKNVLIILVGWKLFFEIVLVKNGIMVNVEFLGMFL